MVRGETSLTAPAGGGALLAASRARLREWLLSGRLPRPADPTEAEALVATAREQRLAGLLHPAVEALPEGWPEPARQRLRSLHLGQFAQGMRQLELAASVLDGLATAGLRALPLKGAAVAERLYGSVAERPMADLDVLVLDDWAHAVRAVTAEGFRECGRADHAWSFRHGTSGLVLELHHGLTAAPSFFPVDAEGLWRRTCVGRGVIGRGPGPEDLLVHLSLHLAFQHGLVLSLGQYLDVRRLLERESLDPDLLAAIAEQTGAEAALVAALEAASAVVGARVPAGMGTRPGTRAPRGFETWLRRRLRDPSALLPPALPAIGRTRWALARGRRSALVGATFCPRAPGSDSSRTGRARSFLRRAATLVRRLRWRSGRP